MKSVFATILFVMATQSAFADVTVIPSKLEGQAVEMPDGLMMIMNPQIKIGDRNYFFYSNDSETGYEELNNAKKTADVICSMVGRKYVGWQSDGRVETGRVVFTTGGSMRIISGNNASMISTITCK